MVADLCVAGLHNNGQEGRKQPQRVCLRRGGLHNIKYGGGRNGRAAGQITIRSSAAEYLTFIAATGDDKNSVEVRYED